MFQGIRTFLARVGRLVKRALGLPFSIENELRGVRTDLRLMGDTLVMIEQRVQAIGAETSAMSRNLEPVPGGLGVVQDRLATVEDSLQQVTKVASWFSRGSGRRARAH